MSVEETWRQFGSETGGEFIKGKESGFGPFRLGMPTHEVVFEVDRWSLKLGLKEPKLPPPLFNYGGARTGTYMSAYRPNGVSFEFDLRRRGLSSSVAWALGRAGGIRTDDFDFDSDFIIKGDDESKVRALLADGTVRERIQARDSIYLSSTPPDTLFFESLAMGYVLAEDAGYLKSIHQLFVALLHQLDEIADVGSEKVTHPKEQSSGWR